jgi:hypothetical protein
VTRQLSPEEATRYYRELDADRAEHERLPSSIDGLRLRRVMHEMTGIDFLPPRRYFTGWTLDSKLGVSHPLPGRPDHRVGDTRVIVTVAPYADDGTNPDGAPEWVHASISHHDRTPTYAELAALHAAAFGPAGRSHLVFVPEDEHINIHPHALHLWGRLDGTRLLPDFGVHGTI